MTFDDGVVGVYTLGNISEKGKMPKQGLTLYEEFAFGYDVLGLNRYYTALEAKQQIEAVINIPEWRRDIVTDTMVAIIADENGNLEGMPQYTIRMTQPMLDEDGLRMTKLSLERINEAYDIQS